MAPQPLYQQLFPETWQDLPKVFQSHYGNRAGCDDDIVAHGHLDIWLSPFMRPLAVLLKRTQTLVPVSERNVPTTVTFQTRRNAAVFWFDRIFRVSNGAPVNFRSEMEILAPGDVVEWTNMGVGCRCLYSYTDGQVRLDHGGYRFRWGRINIALPLEWIMGRTSATETALDDTCFSMEMAITHPVLGKLYTYQGQFELTEFSWDKCH